MVINLNPTLMPCRKITITWLWPCIVIFYVLAFVSKAQCQIQRPATKDSLHPLHLNQLSDKALLLKNGLRNAKDSLQSFKDSIRSLLKSTFRNQKTTHGEDSLNQLLNTFSDRDSLSDYLASHLGYDPKNMHTDSLIKKLNSLSSAELKETTQYFKTINTQAR